MKRYFVTALFFVLLFLVQNTVANEQYKFRTMSPPGGFSYDGVQKIVQDSNGFIWIMLSDEIYRFDGYSYKRHRTYFSKIDEMHDWRFLNVEADNSGKLYINTNKGLYEYQSDTDDFRQINQQKVADIIIDSKENLWFQENGTWYIRNKNPKAELQLVMEAGNPAKNLSTIHCHYKDDFFLLSQYGKVFRYDFKQKELKFCVRTPDSMRLVLDAHAQNGKLWVLQAKGMIYQFDIATFNLEETIQLPERLDATLIRDYLFDKNANLWIATIDGLFQFNPTTKQLLHFQHEENNPFSIGNNSVWSIDEDRQGNIWFGAYSGVLNYLNFNDYPSFKTFTPSDMRLNHAPVSAFAENEDYLWIGTEGGGINRMNKLTGEFDYYSMTGGSRKLSSNNIKSMVIDKNNHLWVGTFQGGIDRLNILGDEKKNFLHTDDENSLRVNNIRKLVLEGDSGIWIAYQQSKLEISYFSFRDERFTHYDFADGNLHTFIFDIVRGPGNQLWILTKSKLYRMDIGSKKVEVAAIQLNRFMNFTTMTFDDNGSLWIGTIGNGLVQCNPTTFECYVHHNVLQHDVSSIFNILYDDGKLWLGTDNGLLKYDVRSKEINHFNEYDGIQGRLFYPLAVLKGQENKYCFGGTNGFTIVNTDLMQKSKFKPKVIISEFLIDYVPAKLKLIQNKNQSTLKLKYTQNNFGFKFSTDNYLNPEKVYYKFRLKGYDDRWIEVDADSRTAFYSKVPPGTYYFEVYASNNDGVWNDEPTVLKIVRKPAPWASSIAYLLYFVLLALLAHYFWRHYKNQKKLELQLYLENIEREKKEEIHQSQLTFFTNISHDFRTPLSLILASVERAREEGLKEYFYQILNNNARRLLNLVNELMDFRTIENNKMQLELQKTDVNQLVRKFAADFDDFADQKKIKFSVVCDENLQDNIYIDRKVLEKVVMNLLNNAFKYTNEGGAVTIETHTQPYVSAYSAGYTVNGECKPSEFFVISVRDNGVGISKESIETVFERFYKVKSNNLDSHLGTGVGLALVKSLVTLHRGSISIYSERDKGTDMLVCFSTNKDTYDPENFALLDEAVFDTDDTLSDGSALMSELIDVDPDEVFDDSIPQKLKKKILFAEDNEELRRLVADSLSEEYEVFEAVDGVDADEILAERNVDLIISDIMMPRKDGITFCNDVKSNIETSHIPVILLTAKTSVESKLEGADTGADVYLEKPISLELLKSNIRNIFKQRQQLKEYYAKNHYADSAELSSNERDTVFLHQFIDIIEKNMMDSEMDVNFLATAMSMSRSKLYRKIKTMTDMSIVEFVLSYKLKKAARLLIEENMSMREIMDVIGIESQPYFTNAFKKEYGETPTAFAAKHKG